LQLDEQEKKIVRELIRNPRASDNQISKKTSVPVMTVNRKRKKLEERGLLYYFTYINNTNRGTGLYHARQLYIVKFKIGLTREKYLQMIESDKRLKETNAKHIVESFIGEKDGHLALMLIMEAKSEGQLVEIFNGDVVENFKKNFGEDCIDDVSTVKLNLPIRVLHNYLPYINMTNGKMKEEWGDNWIFVSE
jgi:DNA-binding Lrp family transcriptional regulator